MATKTDEYIKQEIVDYLIWDDSVNANDVFVNVAEGIVQLSGVVPTHAAKLAAEKDAYRVAGVIQVENMIEVEFPAEVEIPSDTEIINMIESKLLWHDQIDATNITVESNKGIVSLTGMVNSFWEKKLATDTAFATKGVRQVNNNLSVLLEKTYEDTEIENDIKQAFKRNILIDESRINVSVKSGIAHLTGILPLFSMKEEAFDTAMLTAGVMDVVDETIIA
ncbi:MAG: BON domain-containing protein [Bacteroidota bacterium]